MCCGIFHLECNLMFFLETQICTNLVLIFMSIVRQVAQRNKIIMECQWYRGT